MLDKDEFDRTILVFELQAVVAFFSFFEENLFTDFEFDFVPEKVASLEIVLFYLERDRLNLFSLEYYDSTDLVGVAIIRPVAFLNRFSIDKFD